MIGPRYVPAVLLGALLLLPACTAEEPNDPPTVPQPRSETPEPGGVYDVPSAASHIGAEPGELRVEATKNDKGQYRLRPGQQITLKIDFRNLEAKPMVTKIIIEALCQNSRFDGSDSFTVPSSDGESQKVITWTGTATIPADCEPLGIAGVADGSLNAEVRTASDDLGHGRSSTVTFTVTE